MNLFEAPTDPFILGAINAWGDIFHQVARDDDAKHPQGWRAYKTWRYIPDTGLLMWWETPDEGEKLTVEDWLEGKGYEVNIRSVLGQPLRVREAIKSLKGTPIKRYQNKVGKLVGPQLYVHRKYASEVIPHDKLKFAAELLKQIKPTFRFNSVMWNRDTGEIRFDEAPDFDTAREPHVGKYIAISPDGVAREGQSNSIWHHKWLWVKDDYQGFDVDKAKEWSMIWLAKLPAVAKGTDASFQAQLAQHGVENKPVALKELLMTEASKDKAALEWLKHMVQSGPFRGKVFLAGGAVRDMEMGKDPKDLDVVVIGAGLTGGIDFTKWLAQQMGNYKEGSNPVTFPTFGTAKVVLTGQHNGVDLDGMDVEAVASRKEQYTKGSRKPEVAPGTLEDDVFRRDFTVNSLVMDLTTGQILDLTGKGKADIKQGILRTTSDPDIIFGQDALRMFRAIRFATKYNWRLAPELVAGIKKNLENLGNTSRERVRDELNKILVTGNPRKGFELLRDTGLLPYVAQEFQQAVGMTQNKYHNQTVFDHILSVLEKTKPTLISRIGALLHDIGKVATKQVIDGEVNFYEHERIGADIAEKIMTELKYPNDIIKPVVLVIKNHMRLKQSGLEGEKISDKALRKFIVDMGNHLDDVMDIIHSDNISHSDEFNMPNQVPNLLKRIEKLKLSIPDKKSPLPVTGEDLKRLGLLPGPLFKELLDLVRDKQLESPNTKKEEYLEIIKKHLLDKS